MAGAIIRWTLGLGLALSLDACTTFGRKAVSPAPGNLVGTWAYAEIQEDGSSPLANTKCETDFGVVYEADGTFSGYEEAGTWRVEGDDLIETITRTWDMGNDDGSQVPQPRPSRIRLDWKSPDIVNLVSGKTKSGYALIRCRQQPY